MSMRAPTIVLSVTAGVVLLLGGLARADDRPTARAGGDADGVPDRVVAPPVSRTVAQEAEDESMGARRPRVILRDLRAREGFDVLHDEFEGFDRFFRFRSRLAEQEPRSDGYYSPYYDPYRSFVGDYISLSEYERYRKTRDRHRREMEVRKAHLLSKHEQAVVGGVRLLKEGRYRRAVIALTLAAELNHADPACRIHLAQARLARGQYREAGLVLRRALQLQPKLVYADLHLDKCYQDEDELDRYTDELDEWLQENAAHAEVYFLLGFLEFQRGDFAAAHVAFTHVQSALPDDDLTRSYLEITKPGKE